MKRTARRTPALLTAWIITAGLFTGLLSAVYAVDRLPDRRTDTSSSRPAKTGARTSATAASSQTMVELLQELDALRTEMQELRNQIEIQSHELDQLKQQQRAVLADTDQRLSRLEGKPVAEQSGTETTPATGSTTPSTATSDVKPGARTPGGATGATPSSAAPKQADEAKKEYDAAIALMRKRDYDGARKAFQGFLLRHPKSDLADNAQYWLGEAYYVHRQLKSALAEFEKVEKNYPASSKVPDALLKIGYIYYETEQWAKARQTLELVTKRYPGSRIAKKATAQLAKLKKRGH